MPKDIRSFLFNHPIFTVKEFSAFLNSRTRKTQESILRHYVRTGRILRVRRALYISIPYGMEADSYPIDPYLLAAKLEDDAVLAYHTALEFFGKAYSVHRRFLYCTNRWTRPLSFRGLQFRSIAFPRRLKVKDKEDFAVEIHDREGINVRVTSLERTLVDLLDRPMLSGGWEEIWRSLDSVEFFDLDRVVDYTLLFEKSTICAKVGLYLEQRREPLMVNEHYLEILRSNRPKSPHYLERQSSSAARLVPAWNLIVPISILDRSWEEGS